MLSQFAEADLHMGTSETDVESCRITIHEGHLVQRLGRPGQTKGKANWAEADHQSKGRTPKLPGPLPSPL